MPPKVKKKKKTKEELEEERRQAEEAARAAEEERLRLEELEFQRLEELERQRVELLATYTEQENERVANELQELAPLAGQRLLERNVASEARRQAWEWERFLACTYVPHPRDRVAIAGHIRMMQQASDTSVADALAACLDCYAMIDEAEQERLSAILAGDWGSEAYYAKEISSLLDVCSRRVDRVTAHVLQHSDEHANEKGEVLLGVNQGSLQWALWVNISKNPRLKAVEMMALQMVVEIPKQIALASVALRVFKTEKDEFFSACRNEFMAVGGVIFVDLLALPPPAKHVKHWVLRQVQSQSPSTIIISTTTVTTSTTSTSINTTSTNSTTNSTQSDTQVQSQSPYRVLDGSMVLSNNNTSDSVTALASNVQRIPYPIPPAGTDPATYRSEEEPPPLGFAYPYQQDIVLLEGAQTTVGPGYASLLSPSDIPALQPLLGQQHQPEQLLLALSRKGLHLLPEDRDAPVCGMAIKQRDVEVAMCDDLALLAGVCLIARSRWNQAGAGVDECIARISEVADWEAGGRTELRQVERVFAKEREDGERRVLAVIRRGTRGVAFTDALNKREQYPALPGHETVESVRACFNAVYGEVHASLLALMKGVTPNAPALSSTSGASAGNRPDSATAVQPTVGQTIPPEPLLAQRLCLSADGLEMVRNTDPLFTQALAQMLILLRVFSFS
ncbi:hypothetical protein QJQ45_004409 [Haematococcus lacustris]|nr:hypothetical protein QJQ45_004409 [Haematococcus lacustris]